VDRSRLKCRGCAQCVRLGVGSWAVAFGQSSFTLKTLKSVLLAFGLCFAKILYALKIARFPVATDVPSGLSLHPPSAKILSRGEPPRGVPVYIKDEGTRTFSRPYVGSD
jgi:hypothetical protein